jgi:hypothetical protein
MERDVRVITCDYLEVEIPIIVFIHNHYWYWNEDNFVYYDETCEHYLTLDYVIRKVEDAGLRRKL